MAIEMIMPFKKTFAAMVVSSLFGCAGKPVIQTQVIDRPIQIPCEVQIPGECKDAYAVDRVSPADNMLAVNRALRAEVEERAACEVKMRAAVKGCSQTLGVKQ
jgi:hypothetical protein